MSEEEKSVTEIVESACEQPEPKQSPRVKLIVQDPSGNKTTVLLKHSTPISKLLDAYCNKTGVDSRNYRLIHNGKLLLGAERVGSYNMKDNDVIELFPSQVGG